MRDNALMLCILDGWGHSDSTQHNAIAAARLPFFTSVMQPKTSSLLQASGLAVGVPPGQMGNSEVGHMTIGSGRIIKQDLERINQSIATHELENKLLPTIAYLKMHNKTLHMLGLISDGGVHSHIEHIIAIGQLLKKHQVNLCIHAITDGRDVPPSSATKYIQALQSHDLNISSLSGRFYAMDRDNRFERTEKYYRAIVDKQAKLFENPLSIVGKTITDEFIEPHISHTYHGINEHDVIFIANFRADRIRQIAQALLDKDFQGFKTRHLSTRGVSITSCSAKLDAMLHVLFEAQEINNTLGEVISNHGYKQLRAAETEKYAHVTYFFNAGRESPYSNEDRILVASPKVETYDECPEMSAHELTQALVKKIHLNQYQFICANFANTDMVGHTANMAATILACETVDYCLSQIASAAAEHNLDLLITADHGNAEQLMDLKSNQRHTAHTTNAVPLIYVGTKSLRLRNGELQDVAPTILKLMNIAKPKEMTGQTLID